MRKMKDSGIKWIGQIPQEWNLQKIKYTLLQRIENNSPIKTANILSLTAKQGVVPISEKVGGGNKPKEDISAYRLAYPNDIVINSMNILSGSVGISNYFGCVSPVYYMLRPINFSDDVRFYNYIFQTTVFQKSLFGLGNGILIKESGNGKFNTVRMRIPIEKFGNLYIPVSNFQEHKIISLFLDKKCERIDSITLEILKQLEILENYKRSIISEVVTKGLDPNVEIKYSGIEWIGNIPKKWNVIRGKYILHNLQKPVLITDEVITCFRDGEVTLRCNRREEGFTVSEKEIGYQGVDVGDLVVHGMDGFAGAIGISDSRGKASPVLNVLDTEQNKRYIMYFLRSMAYREIFSALSTGIRVRSCDLRWNKLSDLPYLVPSIEEQTLIADYLDHKCSEIDSIISQKKQQLSALEEYKKSLIYEYVTGKKEVIAETTVSVAIPYNILLAIVLDKIKNHEGKTQVLKLMYLVNQLLFPEHKIQYYRYEHGPYDIAIDSNLRFIKEQDWFNIDIHKSPMLWIRGKNYQAFKNACKPFSKHIKFINNLIQSVEKCSTKQLERFATLFAVWNDFIIDGIKNPTDDEIITEVLNNWTPNKKNFKKSTWQQSLDKMRVLNLIPNGNGLHTKKKGEK